jgi:hypothetical protein
MTRYRMPGRFSRRALCCWMLGLISFFCYVVIARMSWDFGLNRPATEHPTLWMLWAFCLAFLCYWLAQLLLLRLPDNRFWVGWIIVSSVLFRVVMLPSAPIHEIDIYRYLWDGAVTSEGINPYRFSPQEVIDAADGRSRAAGTHARDALMRLVELQNRSASLADALGRIHYGDLSSPYPPVSQWVFALAASWTPDHATPSMRLVIMKCLLMIFDLATLFVLLLLLGEAGRSLAWSLSYGWSPLVLKEIAGSGHLDSIAIFLSVLSLWLLVVSVRKYATSPRCRFAATLGTGLALSLAIGAKLYPVLLLPLLALLWWRKFGPLCSVGGVLATLVLTLVLLRPMVLPSGPSRAQSWTSVSTGSDRAPAPDGEGAVQVVSLPPPPAEQGTGPQAGLGAFLGHWEMNDLLFMIVLENLRPQAEVPPQSRPWFVLMPEDWSRRIVIRWSEFLNWIEYRVWGRQTPKGEGASVSGRARRGASFQLARMLTAAVFVGISLWLAVRLTLPPQGVDSWCRAALLTLAWFWLLCPTQNPWYWCWVMPLVPFARFRAWHLVSACSMAYYLRFWLLAHFPEPPVLGTRYDGEHFYYFVVVWIEFVPCLLWLLLEWIHGKRTGR